MKQDISDTQYEVQSFKDIQKNQEKVIETNHSENKQEAQGIRTKAENNEQAIAALKKQIGLLDDKLKNMMKSAALAGNTSMAGDLLGDLEKKVDAIRQDLDKHKTRYESDQARIANELADKATKQDLADLEARMMQRLQDMFD